MYDKLAKRFEEVMDNSHSKKILLINHYAGSPKMGMEFRPYYFAREWVKLGNRVDIIAADYSHLRIENPAISKDFDEEIIDGIHYHWIHTGKYAGNGSKRAITMFQFVGKLWVHAKRIAKTLEPDVIITSSTYPLDTYAGQQIKKFCSGVKLIHEIHDMWPISPIEIGGMSPSHPFIRLMQRAENSFCRNSDRIVSLPSHAYKYLMEHGMTDGKFVHIPNGIIEDEWKEYLPLTSDIQKKIESIKSKHDKIICFFGSHTVSYALDYIIDAIKTFNTAKAGLLLVGSGIYKDELIKRAGHAENIHFMEAVPKKNIPDLLRQIDIIYIGALNSRMFRFGICMNKLYDSMMAGKPILYAVNAPNNYIKDYSCGISVEPESTEALIEGIDKLLNMSDEALNTLGQNGKQAVLQNFTIKILAEEFAKIM